MLSALVFCVLSLVFVQCPGGSFGLLSDICVLTLRDSAVSMVYCQVQCGRRWIFSIFFVYYLLGVGRCGVSEIERLVEGHPNDDYRFKL